MGGKKLDLVDQRFGRLVILEEAGRNKFRNVLWRCKCDCGQECIVVGSNLSSGRTTSCGCYGRVHRITHGMSKTRLYCIWEGILKRAGVWKCANKQIKHDYIDRRITVCDDWLIFENFRGWSLSHGYADDLQIDRIDNDKGYCPDNCRWVSHKENCNNKRNNLRLPDGTPLAMFCSEIGIETCEKGKLTSQYDIIRKLYRKHHKIHPKLLQRLKQDVHDQARALYEVSMKRQSLQDRVENLRKVLNALKNNVLTVG